MLLAFTQMVLDQTSFLYALTSLVFCLQLRDTRRGDRIDTLSVVINLWFFVLVGRRLILRHVRAGWHRGGRVLLCIFLTSTAAIATIHRVFFSTLFNFRDPGRS